MPGNDEVGLLMLEQLKLMRGDIAQMRGDIAQTNERIDQTNEQLDGLRRDMTRGFIETNTKLADLSGKVETLTSRFDHFVELAGGSVRGLDATVEEHERRISALEARVGGVVRDETEDYGGEGS